MKYILILIVLFSGCVTQKRCSERFPCISGKDSIYIQKLDTVRIEIPGDSLVIETKAPCDDFELKVENSKLLASLKSVNGILYAKLNEKPDTVFRFTTNTVTVTKEVTKPVEVRFIPKWVKILAYIGAGALILGILFVFLKIKKIV